jgi:hypothetical protein
MKTWSESLVPSQVHSAKLSVGTMEIDRYRRLIKAQALKALR